VTTIFRFNAGRKPSQCAKIHGKKARHLTNLGIKPGFVFAQACQFLNVVGNRDFM
jgi:hypothetical protein